MTVHYFPTKGEHIRQIRSGRKKFEVRLNTDRMQKVEPGDALVLHNYHGLSVEKVVDERNWYSSLDTMFKRLGLQNVLPGYKFSVQHAIENVFYSFENYQEQEETLGVWSFKLRDPDPTTTLVTDVEAPIYKVWCVKSKTNRYVFYGKPKGSLIKERITLIWMRENNMDDEYIQMLKDHPRKPYIVPEGRSEVKVQHVECPTISDSCCCSRGYGVDVIVPNFYNQGVLGHCTSLPLGSVSSYKGLDKHEKVMVQSVEKIRKSKKNRLTKSVDTFYNVGGWSEVRHLGGNFNPMDDPTPENIKIIQLCSAPITHYDNEEYHDNTHCIVIVDNLIFDSNQHSPLMLTKYNLNMCCLGGGMWVFHHVSRGYEFIPSSKLQRKMNKNKKNRKRKVVSSSFIPNKRLTIL